MKKETAKRRSLTDTVADLIKSGEHTQQELDEARKELLQEPEWQIPTQPKPAPTAN